MSTPAREDVKVLSSDLKGFRGTAWHIEIAGKHYVISAISNEFGNEFGNETMAFPADERGSVTGWGELAFVRGRDHEACIADLLRTLGGAS